MHQLPLISMWVSRVRSPERCMRNHLPLRLNSLHDAPANALVHVDAGELRQDRFKVRDCTASERAMQGACCAKNRIPFGHYTVSESPSAIAISSPSSMGLAIAATRRM